MINNILLFEFGRVFSNMHATFNFVFSSILLLLGGSNNLSITSSRDSRKATAAATSWQRLNTIAHRPPVSGAAAAGNIIIYYVLKCRITMIIILCTCLPILGITTHTLHIGVLCVYTGIKKKMLKSENVFFFFFHINCRVGYTTIKTRACLCNNYCALQLCAVAHVSVSRSAKRWEIDNVVIKIAIVIFARRK